MKFYTPMLGSTNECIEQGTWKQIENQLHLEFAMDEKSSDYLPKISYVASSEGQDVTKIKFISKDPYNDTVMLYGLFGPTRIKINENYYNSTNYDSLILPKQKVKNIQFRTALGVYPKANLIEGFYDEIIIEYTPFSAYSKRCGLEMAPWRFYFVDKGLLDQDSIFWKQVEPPKRNKLRRFKKDELE